MIRIEYDNQPDDIIDSINKDLAAFNLKISEVNGGDGFMEYEIVKHYSTQRNQEVTNQALELIKCHSDEDEMTTEAMRELVKEVKLLIGL